MVEWHKNDAETKGNPWDNLPNSELEVVACLWNKKCATARDLREAMDGYRPMTHGAMVTLLKRLEEKGLVRKEKGAVGKAFVYEATRGPERVHRRIMRDLHERIFGGSGVAMVASLFETRPPTPDELDDIQRLLDDMRARRKRENKS